MSTVARIVFLYDDNLGTEETASDLDALDSKLKAGVVIERNGRYWRIISIDVERPSGDPEQNPVWRVRLKAVVSDRLPSSN